MLHIALIAAGGMVGALSRYGLSRFIAQAIPSSFPLGTMVINLSGSFLIGVFFEIFERSVLPPDAKSFITIGFLGAYTTFSTFTLETVNLLRDGEWGSALVNMLLSNILGIVMVFAGLWVVKALLGR